MIAFEKKIFGSASLKVQIWEPTERRAQHRATVCLHHGATTSQVLDVSGSLDEVREKCNEYIHTQVFIIENFCTALEVL